RENGIVNLEAVLYDRSPVPAVVGAPEEGARRDCPERFGGPWVDHQEHDCIEQVALDLLPGEASIEAAEQLLLEREIIPKRGEHPARSRGIDGDSQSLKGGGGQPSGEKPPARGPVRALVEPELGAHEDRLREPWMDRNTVDDPRRSKKDLFPVRAAVHALEQPLLDGVERGGVERIDGEPGHG